MFVDGFRISRWMHEGGSSGDIDGFMCFSAVYCRYASCSVGHCSSTHICTFTSRSMLHHS